MPHRPVWISTSIRAHNLIKSTARKRGHYASQPNHPRPLTSWFPPQWRLCLRPGCPGSSRRHERGRRRPDTCRRRILCAVVVASWPCCVSMSLKVRSRRYTVSNSSFLKARSFRLFSPFVFLYCLAVSLVLVLKARVLLVTHTTTRSLVD